MPPTTSYSVISVVDRAREDPGFRVLITGQATVSQDFEELATEGLLKGEVVGIPLAVIILVLVFGALVAALVPVILAAASIVVAFGAALSARPGHRSHLLCRKHDLHDRSGRRHRLLPLHSGRATERSVALAWKKLNAIGKAGATATRTVSFSGMAVVLGLVGMLLVPSNVFIAIGLGAIFVVIAAVFASMTLLPAILSLLGDRVNKLSIPWFGMAHAGYDETRPGGFWDRISRGVMRQPLISLLLAGGLLVAALIPFFDINTGSSGVSSMPDGIEAKEGFLILGR